MIKGCYCPCKPEFEAVSITSMPMMSRSSTNRNIFLCIHKVAIFCEQREDPSTLQLTWMHMVPPFSSQNRSLHLSPSPFAVVWNKLLLLQEKFSGGFPQWPTAPSFFCGCLEQMAVAFEKILSSSTVLQFYTFISQFFTKMEQMSKTGLILAPSPLQKKKSLLGYFFFWVLFATPKILSLYSYPIEFRGWFFNEPLKESEAWEKLSFFSEIRPAAYDKHHRLSLFTFGFIHPNGGWEWDFFQQ